MRIFYSHLFGKIHIIRSMKIVILAGGGGTRLWPLSREESPKQVLPILGKNTLLQQAYQRLRWVFSPGDILVVTGKKYQETIRKQLPSLPKVNLLLEPERRNSAGAIGLAAYWLGRRNSKEVIVSIHSDHWVSDDKAFAQIIKKLGRLAASHPEETIIVGAKPTYPETGYGYIQVDKKIVQPARVKCFKEKPDLKTAQRFIASGNYLWNVGWFAWRVDHLIKLFEKHLPANAAVLSKISQAKLSRWQQVLDKEFPKLKAANIDNSIIEKTARRLVVPINIGWTDIGHWRSVYEMSSKDKNNNVVLGESLLLDSRDNLFWVGKKKAIASLGVNNLILIETPDMILVADKSQAQNVKQLVAELKNSRSLKKYL